MYRKGQLLALLFLALTPTLNAQARIRTVIPSVAIENAELVFRGRNMDTPENPLKVNILVKNPTTNEIRVVNLPVTLTPRKRKATVRIPLVGTDAKVQLQISGGDIPTTTPNSNLLLIIDNPNLNSLDLFDADGNPLPSVPSGFGADGAVGPQGPKGDKGDTGAAGAAGPSGPAGATGPAGAQGPQGIQGPVGPAATSMPGSGVIGAVDEAKSLNNSVQSLVLTGNSSAITFTAIKNANLDINLPNANGTLATLDDLNTAIASVTGGSGTVGPQGPAGATGAKGDKGDQGDVGPQGPQGLQGIQGIAGTNGVDGAQGPKGDKGDKGDTPTSMAGSAIVGPVDNSLKAEMLDNANQTLSLEGNDSGITFKAVKLGDLVLNLPSNNGTLATLDDLAGVTGTVGPQGPAGAKGDKGDQGDVGPQGPQGLQGIQGIAGANGADGAQGPKGDKGDKGDTPTSMAGSAIVGPVDNSLKAEMLDNTHQTLNLDGNDSNVTFNAVKLGDLVLNLPANDGTLATLDDLAGVTGTVGPQGPAGAKGDKGDQGDVGPQGPQGPAGATGAQGAVGPQGPAGSVGATGAQGPAGAQGIQGLKGDKGDKGDTGATPSSMPGSSVVGPVDNSIQAEMLDNNQQTLNLTGANSAITITAQLASALNLTLPNHDGTLATLDDLTPVAVSVDIDIEKAEVIEVPNINFVKIFDSTPESIEVLKGMQGGKRGQRVILEIGNDMNFEVDNNGNADTIQWGRGVKPGRHQEASVGEMYEFIHNGNAWFLMGRYNI